MSISRAILPNLLPLSDGLIRANGGCHCGAVRFSFLTQKHRELLDCNCSVCTRVGYLHLIVDHDDFTLLSGSEMLTSYRFGSGKAEHLFCKKCGIKSFYQPRSHPDCWSVHFACLDDGHGIVAKRIKFDGRNWEEAAEKSGF